MNITSFTGNQDNHPVKERLLHLFNTWGNWDNANSLPKIRN